MLRSLRALAASALVLLPCLPASADWSWTRWNDGEEAPHPALRADDHGPIGVVGDHMHHAGEGMLSFRAMFMDMDGNRDGTSRESTSDVLRQFMVSPTDMTMQAYMAGGMWAPTDDVTLMAMLPILRKDMNHRTRMGGEFRTETAGIGDVKLSGLVRLFDSGGERGDEGGGHSGGLENHVHASLGLSIPTGSVSEEDDTPMGKVRLPYPMQLGSGTWDLLPGLTYTGGVSDATWGAQGRGSVRTGRNTHDYRFGNEALATAWAAYGPLPCLSASLRAEYRWWGDVQGDDDALNPRLVPTADPDRRGGQRIDLLAGVNVVVTGGAFRGNRFGIELGIPVWQYLHGPQLETDWTLTAGWQLAF